MIVETDEIIGKYEWTGIIVDIKKNPEEAADEIGKELMKLINQNKNVNIDFENIIARIKNEENSQTIVTDYTDRHRNIKASNITPHYSMLGMRIDVAKNGPLELLQTGKINITIPIRYGGISEKYVLDIGKWEILIFKLDKLRTDEWDYTGISVNMSQDPKEIAYEIRTNLMKLLKVPIDFENIIRRLQKGENMQTICNEYRDQYHKMKADGKDPQYVILDMRVNVTEDGPIAYYNNVIDITVSSEYDITQEYKLIINKTNIHILEGGKFTVMVEYMAKNPKGVADEIRREVSSLLVSNRYNKPPELDPQTEDVISLEPFSMNTSDYIKLACGHIFNIKAKEWLLKKDICPICRQQVKISNYEIYSVFKFDSIADDVLKEVKKIAKVTPDNNHYIIELTKYTRMNLRRMGLQIVLKNDNLSIVRSQESSAKKPQLQIYMDQDTVVDVKRARGDVVKQVSEKYYTNNQRVKDSEKYYLRASDTNELRDSLQERGLRIIYRARVMFEDKQDSEKYYILQEEGLRIVSTDYVPYIVRINVDNTPEFLGLKLRL